MFTITLFQNGPDIIEIRTTNTPLKETAIYDNHKPVAHIFPVAADNSVYTVTRNPATPWVRIIPEILKMLLSETHQVFCTIRGLTEHMWENIHHQLGILPIVRQQVLH